MAFLQGLYCFFSSPNNLYLLSVMISITKLLLKVDFYSIAAYLFTLVDIVSAESTNFT